MTMGNRHCGQSACLRSRWLGRCDCKCDGCVGVVQQIVQAEAYKYDEIGPTTLDVQRKLDSPEEYKAWQREQIEKRPEDRTPFGGLALKSIQHCARCGGNHTNIYAMKLDQPFAPVEAGGVEWTHWFPCPTNGQPVMVLSGAPRGGSPLRRNAAGVTLLKLLQKYFDPGKVTTDIIVEVLDELGIY